MLIYRVAVKTIGICGRASTENNLLTILRLSATRAVSTIEIDERSPKGTNMSSSFAKPANPQSETRKESRHKREPKGPQADGIRGNGRNEVRDRVTIEALIRLLHRAKKHPDRTTILPVFEAMDQADEEDTLRELCEFDRNAAAHFFLLAFYAGLMRHGAAFLDSELANLRKCADHLPPITDGPPIKNNDRPICKGAVNSSEGERRNCF
jgi:hypothetical protein